MRGRNTAHGEYVFPPGQDVFNPRHQSAESGRRVRSLGPAVCKFRKLLQSGWITRQITILKFPLTHIWQPARKTSKRVMVVLHGRGDSAEGFLWLQDEL